MQITKIDALLAPGNLIHVLRPLQQDGDKCAVSGISGILGLSGCWGWRGELAQQPRFIVLVKPLGGLIGVAPEVLQACMPSNCQQGFDFLTELRLFAGFWLFIQST
ncbi:hypothetical protein D3C80_1526920 [compost metagenome]